MLMIFPRQNWLGFILVLAVTFSVLWCAAIAGPTNHHHQTNSLTNEHLDHARSLTLATVIELVVLTLGLAIVGLVSGIGVSIPSPQRYFLYSGQQTLAKSRRHFRLFFSLRSPPLS